MEGALPVAALSAEVAKVGVALAGAAKVGAVTAEQEGAATARAPRHGGHTQEGKSMRL